MKRSIKKGSGLYEYLESINALQQDDEAIALAKKQYWATVRKEWKRKKRQECKSYAVFFERNELKQIEQQAKHFTGGITQYIKQAALQNMAILDKKMIGEIRQALALYYGIIQNLSESGALPKQAASTLLEQFLLVEKQILYLLLKQQ